MSRPKGVFAMLDEECFVPGGSDKGFCNKICKQFEKHRRFGIIKTKPTWYLRGVDTEFLVSLVRFMLRMM